MDKFEAIPQNIPSNSALIQLDPVSLGGINYHGWEIVFTKTVDSGKDKRTGKEQYGQQIDTSKQPLFDPITSLLKSGKQNSPMLANLMISNSQMTVKISSLSQRLNEVEKQIGGNK